MFQASLSERDVCTKLITPALERAGWDIQGQVREEVPLTHGQVMERRSPPPRRERHIVAKVEHVMNLRDALEAALRCREDRAAKLAEAVVQEMVA